MRRTLERLKIEIRKILGAALFFAVAACLVVFTDKLLVWGSDLRTVSFIAAIVAGLIIAKVMLVLAVLFLVFLTTRELSRALGKDKMRLLFLGR